MDYYIPFLLETNSMKTICLTNIMFTQIWSRLVELFLHKDKARQAYVARNCIDGPNAKGKTEERTNYPEEFCDTDTMAASTVERAQSEGTMSLMPNADLSLATRKLPRKL
jgi:hypothetical protein